MIYEFDKNKLKTIEDYEKAHRDYWNFIADNHLSNKPMIDDSIWYNCFACQYAVETAFSHIMLRCICCPINNKYCGDKNSLYMQWRNAESQEKKDSIAREIAKAKFTDIVED